MKESNFSEEFDFTEEFDLGDDIPAEEIMDEDQLLEAVLETELLTDEAVSVEELAAVFPAEDRRWLRTCRLRNTF